MAVEVILPKVDMDMETGQISRWYAKDGDMVTKGQLLFEIETDKAAMEVEAPASGVIADISAAEGAVVPVGQAVAWIYEEGEERSGKPAAVAQEPIAAAPVDRAIETATPKQHDPKSSQDDERDSADKVRATPLARRLARDAGIDLATVQDRVRRAACRRRTSKAISALRTLRYRPNRLQAKCRTDPTRPAQCNLVA